MTRRTQVFDAALAAVALLLGQAEAWGGVFSSELTGPRWALATAYAICAVALFFRRRHPLAVALVVAAALTADFAAFGSSEGLGLFLVPVIVAYTLGAGDSPRRGLIGLAALLAMGAVWDASDPANAGRLTEHVGSAIWLTPYVVAFVFGLYWRSRRLNLEQAVREQAGRAERAVAEERTRIARELHDAIGHSVAVMTVQTSAVRRLLHGDQNKERAALETVEATGREAMAEMRKIVGVLRSGDEAPDLAPPPNLAQLDRLADNFRHAGLVVDVETVGDTAALAPGLSATVYRVVQESLTNSLKHAAARRVRVVIECRADRLEVTVTDDGRGGAADPAKGAGLTGMRERVKVYGGTLLAGPAASGGFTVHAVLPGWPVMIRVVIADDQALMRAGFRMIFEAEPDIELVGEASDGAEAVRVAYATSPDVVIMDVRMPGLNGIEATRALVADGGTATRVIMLTTFDMDEYVYDALLAGASGFLLKDLPPEQLILGIRAVCRGESLLSPVITRRMIETFIARPRANVTTPDARLGLLTPREREVLTLLGRGRSNPEIAAALYVSETTVKTHVQRILAKLGLRDRIQAVIFAYEAGVIQIGSRDR